MKLLVALVIACLVLAVSATNPDPVLRDLANKVKGRILTAEHADYKDAITVFSPRHGLRPAVVIIPRDVEDIQAAMMIAKMHNVPFRVGAGKHNYEGYALADNGMLLSLRDPIWRTVSDVAADGTVTVGGGAQLIDVHRAVIPNGRGVVAGLCPSVGIVPFTLGGGYGSLSRMVGLSADNLVSLTMVLANTSVVRVSAHENHDLWWALRGGGGGNFGIVTSITIRTFPLPRGNDMFMGETCWDWNTHGKQVFSWWADVVNNDATPRELTFSMRSHFGPLDMFAQETAPENTPQQICVQPIYYGTGHDGQRLVNQHFSTLPPVVSDNSFVMPWLSDVEHEHEKVTALYGLPVYIKSGFFEVLTPELVDVLHNAIATAPTIGNCIIDFDHLGGAIADVAANATAYVNREARINLQIIAIWTEGDVRQAEYMAWVDQLFDRVFPAMSGNYVNYISSSLPNWQERYYGVNYARLQSIKKAVDPASFFTFPQAITA